MTSHTIQWGGKSVTSARLLFRAKRKDKTRRNDDCMIHVIHRHRLRTPGGYLQRCSIHKNRANTPHIRSIMLLECVKKMLGSPASFLPTRYDHLRHPLLPNRTPQKYRHPKSQQRTAKPVPSRPKVSVTPLQQPPSEHR